MAPTKGQIIGELEHLADVLAKRYGDRQITDGGESMFSIIDQIKNMVTNL